MAFVERVMYLDLIDADSGSRVFLALLSPGPPANALMGVMLGRVFHDPNPEIAVTRFLAVRIPGLEATRLDGTGAYLHPAEESLSNDLRRRGVPLSRSGVLDSLLNGFLAGKEEGGLVRVTAVDNYTVNVGVDRALASRRGAEAPARPAHAPDRGPGRRPRT